MSLPEAPFGRVLTAMVTPFAPDGSVDLAAVERVAAHLVDNGCDGIVVSGTTGEAPTTTIKEDGETLKAVITAVGERATVVAGVGTNDTVHSIELIEQATKLGADGALLVTPYYNKPTQAGVVAHVKAVAGMGGIPVMLYDIPGRAGIAIAPETYVELAALDEVVAVKDAVGDIERGVKIAAETGLTLYSGDDGLNLAWLTHGAAGVVSVVAHAAANEYAAMVTAVDRGDLDQALRIYRDLIPVVDAMMGHVPRAVSSKAVLELKGVLDNRRVRLPYVEAPDDVVALLREVLASR